MDPDMVRQQAEAEREALALLHKKPAPASIPHAVLAGSPRGAAPVSPKEAPGLAAAAPSQEPAAFLELEAPAPRHAPAPRRAAFHMAAQIGRALSFGLAGAILGGGLGILASNYVQLSAGWAKLAIFGPAALVAGACAAVSFYTKTSHE